MINFVLSDEDKAYLGQVARASIEAGLRGEGTINVDAPVSAAVDAELGAFVSLHLRGNLRGCIGNMIGQGPLYSTVARMARSAAFNDNRFRPLTSKEWPHIDLEISVLGPLLHCPDPDAIEIGRHGLLLVHRGQSGVFLPQVPVEQGWDRQVYLQNLCRKAGLADGSWLLPGAELYWFEACVFPVNEDCGMSFAANYSMPK